MKNSKNMKQPQRPDPPRNILSQEDWDEFERGINYFNDSRYTSAFEAWKLVSERCGKDDKQLVFALMETARVFQMTESAGIIKGISKVAKLLKPYSPEHCGLFVSRLITSLDDIRGRIESADPHKHPADFLKMKIEFLPPSNPDLDAEVAEICSNEEFLRGIRLFNRGYYWEAHEQWEELWRDQAGAGKSFMESFVHLAEGYSFAKKGKIEYAQYLFSKVVKKFQDYRQVQCRISITAILNDIEKAVVEINSFRRNGTKQFVFSSPPVISMDSTEKPAQ